MELLHSAEGIATNVLADRLRLLQREGIAPRPRNKENGERVDYHLTDKGWHLAPVLLEMIAWSARYDPDSPVGPELPNEIEPTRDAIVKRWRASHD